MKCPHCHGIDSLELLSDEAADQVPRSWKFGQVGLRDKLYHCTQCKKVTAVDQVIGTTAKVGMSEFVF